MYAKDPTFVLTISNDKIFNQEILHHESRVNKSFHVGHHYPYYLQ